MGSPGAQLRKPRDVSSVQAQPTATWNELALERDRGGCTRNMGAAKSEAVLTVAVPGEADPQVVIFGVVEVPDELHLCPAVKRRQLSSNGQTVVP